MSPDEEDKEETRNLTMILEVVYSGLFDLSNSKSTRTLKNVRYDIMAH